MTPTSKNLRDPAVMLETLKLAYQRELDASGSFENAEAFINDRRRLSFEQERELGRRLTEYWTLSLPQDRA